MNGRSHELITEYSLFGCDDFAFSCFSWNRSFLTVCKLANDLIKTAKLKIILNIEAPKKEIAKDKAKITI